MKAAKFLGLAVLTLSVSGIAQAAPTAKKSVRVVEGAKALSTLDKANITGMSCGCPEYVERKPGYGFGAPVEHYGPPGQGFENDLTWRNWTGHGWAALGGQEGMTPNGHPLPPPAFTLWSTTP
jgi:hypothetical protein